VRVDDPSIFRPQLQAVAASSGGGVELRATQPQSIDITLECLKSGVSRVHLSIPLSPGFCAVGVSFRKECHVAGGGSSALWWLLLLLGLPLCCCCCCLTPEARAIWLKHLTGHPINTREAHTIYPVSESGEFKATAALSRSSVRYGAVTLSSRVRMALEELRSGQLRVDQVPARLAASPRSGMRHLPDEDEQELL